MPMNSNAQGERYQRTRSRRPTDDEIAGIAEDGAQIGDEGETTTSYLRPYSDELLEAVRAAYMPSCSNVGSVHPRLTSTIR
jgi:hypothetical protein